MAVVTEPRAAIQNPPSLAHKNCRNCWTSFASQLTVLPGAPAPDPLQSRSVWCGNKRGPLYSRQQPYAFA